MARASSLNGQQRGARCTRPPARSAFTPFCLIFAVTVLLAGCTKVLGDFRIGANKPPPTQDAGMEAGSLDIVVTPIEGLRTTEWGERTSFTVFLKTAPRANVAIAFHSSDANEGTVSPDSVTFTPANWNAPQTVYVTGVSDDNNAMADGNAIYTIVTSPASSDDPHFSGMDPPDVAMINVDDETPGFIVTPTAGLTTTEWGGTATFTVVLTAPPRDIVTVDLATTLPMEAKVTPAVLAFSPLNYRSPQTVTVTGVDDSDIDGPQTVQITTAPAKSADSAYDRLNASDVQVVNLDDDSAGVTVTPIAGLVTSERGLSSAFTVMLNTEPTAEVSIGFSSSNTKEGTVSPAKLTFTSVNWRAPQTVTVTGVEDDLPDGNQSFKIVLAQLESMDDRYRAIDPSDLDVVNIDNESPWILVTPQSGLVTSEDGLSASFGVALATQPEGEVTLDFSSSAPADSAVNPRRITFTPRNWNAPQIITVTGVDDGPAIDGDVAYYVRGVVEVATSDPGYGALPSVEVTLVNLDNDTPGISITPLDGLTTGEAGSKATFSVALRSKPTNSVRIDLSSGNIAEGSVFPAALTFTPANYNAPQKVTVTGADDMRRDGNQRYSIITAPAVSNDDGYKNLDAPNVTVVNVDDDSPDIIVMRSGDLTTTESGTAATFALRLATAPSAPVAINVSTTNAAEGEVTPGIVTFTPANWSTPQIVTVAGKDDAFADGTQPYRVFIAPATSGDADYQGMDPEDISVVNIDDETASVIVSAEAPLTTTEAGGTATFSIVLGSPPSYPVTVTLVNSRPTEGSVFPTSMIFTSTNWKAPQWTTVTGVDDMTADGHQPYLVVLANASSMDSLYNNLKPSNVVVVNLDDESPGVNVVAARDLTTTEYRSTVEFTVALSAPPASDITIALRSTLPSEGTVSPSSLVFTATDWNAPQVVTVTGADDAVADGPRAYKIILDPPTGDPSYAAIDPIDVDLVNLDNDTPGIGIVPPKIAVTTESGGMATFGVFLMSRPEAAVTVPFLSNNPGEGTLSPSQLRFTTTNWATPQWVTVVGANDTVADGDIPYRIAVGPATSTSAAYQGRRGSDVLLVNLDNDTAGLAVSPAQGSTTEGGIATTFTVALTTQPTDSVTVPIASARPSEGMPLASALVFTPTNWNAPQTVTVRGIDDRVVDGDQVYRVAIGPSASGDGSTMSGDANYKGKRAPPVTIRNLDDDGAAIRVTAAPDLRTTEAGGTATFTVVLASAPTAQVSVPLVSLDTSEGTITNPGGTGTLIFTPANWSIAQTVTVTGADDPEADGSMPYSIRIGPATGDQRYAGRTAADIRLTNVDNDSPGLTISESANLTTTEAGGTATFRMVLNMAPTAGVTFFLSSSQPDEGTLTSGIVHFSTDDWNVPQTVTITGQQDTVADGNQVYAIRFEPAASSDLGYEGLVVDQLSVINLDDDTPPAAVIRQRRPSVKPRREPTSDAQPPR